MTKNEEKTFEVTKINKQYRCTTNIKSAIRKYLDSLNVSYKESQTINLNGESIKVDFLIKEHKLCIDCIRLYENSELYCESKALSNKNDLFKGSSYQLLQIFETLWYKDKRTRDCLKDKIAYICNKAKYRVYARECTVKPIKSSKEKADFINANHVQGTSGSCIDLGLYNKDNTLVAILTFCKPRLAMGQKNEKFKDLNVYELSRYCTLKDHCVVGGCSKLFKYFKDNYDWDKIITYADKRLSKANLYFNAGFMYHHESDGSYYYFKPITKDEWKADHNALEMKYRFNFRKQELLKRYADTCNNWNTLYPNVPMTELNISHSQGFIKVYDSGNYYLEMINPNGLLCSEYENTKAFHNAYCKKYKLNNFIIN